MNARLKEMPPARPKVNQVQRRYLNERLTQAARDKDGPKRDPMPAELRKAERRISSWNLAQHRKEVKARNAIRDSRRKVEQVILFGTPDEALAAVEAFEKLIV